MDLQNSATLLSDSTCKVGDGAGFGSERAHGPRDVSADRRGPGEVLIHLCLSELRVGLFPGQLGARVSGSKVRFKNRRLVFLFWFIVLARRPAVTDVRA